jgi:hypothetical protein
MVMDESIKSLISYISTKTTKELEEICIQHKRETAEKINQRRISEEEYIELLKVKLSEDNLKLFLETTRCKKLFLLLYPQAKSTMDPANPNWLFLSEDDEALESGTSSDGDSNVGWYMDDFFQILHHILSAKRSATRLNFFNFLDLCWEAVGFDLWGRCTNDRVFRVDKETLKKKDLSHRDIRGLFLKHIRDYLIKHKTVAEIGEDGLKYLGDSFSGTMKLLISPKNIK